MSSLISDAWAQSSTGSSSQLAPMVLMVLFIGVFYLLLIRPQQKKAKEHQALVSKLAPGDEVVTTGGMLGKVTDVGEIFITLEVAEGVRVKVQRVQVAQLVPKGTLRSA